MSSHEVSFDRASKTKSKLESLEQELAKSNKKYEYQYNKLEEFITEANQFAPDNQINLKPPTITFKKLRLQDTNQPDRDHKWQAKTI